MSYIITGYYSSMFGLPFPIEERECEDEDETVDEVFKIRRNHPNAKITVRGDDFEQEIDVAADFNIFGYIGYAGD